MGRVSEQVFERVAELDVHKAQVTACVRIPDGEGQRAAHLAEFATTVARPVGVGGLVEGLRGHACGDGGHRRVLEADLGGAGGRLRADARQGHLNAVANFEFERSIARLTGRDRP
jgi:hypothetical protein